MSVQSHPLNVNIPRESRKDTG